MMTIKTQVCVIGAGAGGTGCTYRLIKNGIKTVVVDNNPDFGGTMVFSGVDGWEPGVSLDGMHLLLKDELEKMNGGHTIGGVPNFNIFDSSAGNDWKYHSLEKYPMYYLMNKGESYENTLARCKLLNANGWGRYQFDPDCMIEAIHNVTEPYRENLTSLFGYRYKSCTKCAGRINSVIVSQDDIDVEIVADYFVDATGDIVLARNAGCDYAIGAEGKDEYHEPSAGKKSDVINGVSYVFRISKSADPEHIDAVPEDVCDIDISDWISERMKKVLCYCAQYPNGDINMNMLPTMEGKEYFSFGDHADIIGKARVWAYWNYLQKEKKMKGWYIKKIYDAGIREGYRLKGKYVLTEQDLREGVLKQPKIGRTIAIGDHAMDVHGEGSLDKELDIPYEIPLECTMTKEVDNLFVACRGASFSHLAASSARLTRTMLSLGEGVGEYIAECIMDK